MNTLNYLAGIIDGEGCVGIIKVKPNGLNKTPRHILLLSIQMQEKKVIDFLAKNFERNIMFQKARGNQKRPSYRITWQSEKASTILKKVSPFLIGKRKQADVAIEFQKHLASKNRSGVRLSEEELKIRDNFHYIIGQLKINP